MDFSNESVRIQCANDCDLKFKYAFYFEETPGEVLFIELLYLCSDVASTSSGSDPVAEFLQSQHLRESLLKKKGNLCCP